jgi:probable phosphoglycerate mutase
LPDTRVLLIRHGETAWNAEGRIQGRLDIPLSGTGIFQAACVAERLADAPIDAIIASDLARAWMTALPLAQRRQLEPIAEPRLRERHFGVFQGLTPDEVANRWPAEFRLWRARDPAWAIPEGESGAEFIARVVAAVTDLVTRYSGRTIALVTHGGVLDVLYRQALQLAWDAPRLHQMLNASINELTASTAPLRLTLRGWAEVAHLEAARDELAG